MNSDWQQFLQAQGAAFAGDGSVTFPDAGSSAPCNLFDLSHFGLIAVAGDEADGFLQGQLTNDVRELTDAHSQMSSHCSAKGRMLASFRLIRSGGAIYLQLPRENLQTVLKRFNMFKLRAKVELSDAGDRLVCIGLAGDCAAALLKDGLGEPPALENEVRQFPPFVVVRMPGNRPRFEILGPAVEMMPLWTRFAGAGAVPAGQDGWGLLDIRAGVPNIYGSSVEAFVPQMANMHLVDGVSFTKGCYTGQEVVARMQYLGKLKRRMYRAEIRAKRRPLPGDELVSAASESGQGAGRVVDARPSAEGRFELLAVVETAAAEQGRVFLGQDGPELHFLDLPYPFPETEARPE